jgi:hypothetical protein
MPRLKYLTLQFSSIAENIKDSGYQLAELVTNGHLTALKSLELIFLDQLQDVSKLLFTLGAALFERDRHPAL